MAVAEVPTSTVERLGAGIDEKSAGGTIFRRRARHCRPRPPAARPRAQLSARSGNPTEHPPPMDITAFVVAQRDDALLLGDYNTYRQTCSRRILALRKRTGRATPKNAKFAAKAPATAADVASSHDFLHLLIFTAERAWAHAMHMKSTHAEDNADKGITGSTRKHIISRLHKAAHTARELATVLADPSSGATSTDLLEAQAYSHSLSGAEEFEKQAEGVHSDAAQPPDQRWKQCLIHYSVAHVVYNALLQTTKKDLYKEFLASTIDPSIRYAAYQSRLPRTVSVAQVARQSFPKDNASLVSAIEDIYPNALKDEAAIAGMFGPIVAHVSVH